MAPKVRAFVDLARAEFGNAVALQMPPADHIF
jgi:hypothetical protein